MRDAKPESNVARIVLMAIGVAIIRFAVFGAFGRLTTWGVISGIVSLLVAATAK